MAKVDFNIHFLSGEPTGTTTLFRPGDLLRGQVIISTDSDVNCKNVHARLLWHTEGRGTPYEEKIGEIPLYQGVLKTGMPHSYEFSFDLPRDPWSYEGHYVSIVWLVQIDIDVPWGKDILENKTFLLRPQIKSDN